MRILIALYALVFSLEVSGAPEPYVPPELESWRAWVLDGHEETRCAYTKPLGYLCHWPGELRLNLDDKGARFEQRWWLAIASWVPLPGLNDVWPVSIHVDGKPVPISEQSGQPAVYLAPGEYLISGRFEWQKPPGRLHIPAEAGIISVTYQGSLVEHPNLSGEFLLLMEEKPANQTKDSLKLTVSRLFTDGIPQNLTTAILLEVSGAAREVRLGPAVLDGFKLTFVGAGLPVRITENGVLYAQVRPGRWIITVKTRATRQFNQPGPPKAQPPWPKQEIWSYQDNSYLRVTSVNSSTPIDPRQTQMPGEWRNYPAWVLNPGDQLTIVQHSRGADPNRDNQLTLERNLWLRFDGEAFVIADRLSGQMVVDWRLGMRAPYHLTRLEEAGQPLLLTRLEKDAPAGAEVRRQATGVHGVSILETGLKAVPVSGWNESLQSIDARLHLPPGYRLFAVTGYDQSRGDWLTQWGLISIFGVIIVAVCAARLLGWIWGVLALSALVLTVHAPQAPLWLWLNALLALGLMGVLKQGRLRPWVGGYTALSLLALLVIYLPFALHQARLAFYPQLETPAVYWAETESLAKRADRQRASLGRSFAEKETKASAAPLALAELAGDRYAAEPKHFTPYPDDTLVQAGIAAPEWRWQSVALSLSGPVGVEQTASYWIMPPWLTSLWRFAGVVLTGMFLAGLLWRLYRLSSTRLPRPGAASALIFLLALLPGMALAQTPDPDILKELEQRLTEPPICGAHCAQVQAATITATHDRLTLQFQVHATTRTAIPLPGARKDWMPDRVVIENSERSWLLRKDNRLWAPLPRAGRYTLRLSGPMPDANTFNLAFPERPKHVFLEADGWKVSGIQDGKMVSGALRFIRLAHPNATTSNRSMRLNVPPFVIVEREFVFAVDWSINTRVVRKAPADGTFTVTLPLLPKERVLSDEGAIQIEGNQIKVSFTPQTNRVLFRSRLPQHSPLVLTAADAEHFRQRFSFQVGRLWHLETTGLPPAATVKSGSQHYFPIYFPHPGEQLKLIITRPQPVPGDTLSVDSAGMESRVGLRGHETTLRFAYRATQGGSHTVTLPAGVELESLTLDGREAGSAPVDREVTFAVQPGVHRIAMHWQQPAGNLLTVSTPQPDLNIKTANITLELKLPRDRWVLWTSGPLMGPVVMYWSELVLMLAVALILGRFKRLPLSRLQWVLLGLGLSLTAWPAILMLFAWLLALDWRARHGPSWHQQNFNLAQMGLALASGIVISALIFAIFLGLWSNPDMGIIGQGSTADVLRWFADYSNGLLPAGTVISVPLWGYKGLILLWSIWLSLALIGWLKWAWDCFSEGGLWQDKPRTEKPGQT